MPKVIFCAVLDYFLHFIIVSIIFTRNDGDFSVTDGNFTRIICITAATNINIFFLMIEIFQQYIYNKNEFYEDRLLNE